jgi:hypothetical protein
VKGTTGAKGATGARGPTGVAGAITVTQANSATTNIPTTAGSTTGVIRATCAGTRVATGGGYVLTGDVSTVRVIESRGDTSQTWSVNVQRVAAGAAATVTAWATCSPA